MAVPSSLVWWFPGMAVPAEALCPLESPNPGHWPCSGSFCACFSRGLSVSSHLPPVPPQGMISAVQGEPWYLHVQQTHPKGFRCQELGASLTQPDPRGSAHFPELCSRHGCKASFFQYCPANFRNSFKTVWSLHGTTWNASFQHC